MESRCTIIGAVAKDYLVWILVSGPLRCWRVVGSSPTLSTEDPTVFVTSDSTDGKRNLGWSSISCPLSTRHKDRCLLLTFTLDKIRRLSVERESNCSLNNSLNVDACTVNTKFWERQNRGRVSRS